MNLWVFAWRNLGRQRLRTVLKAVSIGVITAIMLVWGCLNAGFAELLQKTATSYELGEFQLHLPGYLANPDLYALLPEDAAWQRALSEQGFASAPRLFGAALAAAADLSAGVQLRGVDVDQERRVTQIDHYIKDGAWLTPSAKRQVVLGSLLARHLHLAPGQELILLGQAADGSLANEVFSVAGVLKSVNSEIDNRAVYLQATDFRDFFITPTGVPELAVSRLSLDDPFAAADGRIKALAKAKPEFSGAEVKSWQELKPALAKILDLMEISADFIFLFIYLALGGLILNMTFMSIYDRRREFGTMQALGMAPDQVLLVIVAEAVWSSLLTGAVTLTLGFPVALILAKSGLDLSLLVDHLSVSGINLDPVLYAQITAFQVLKPVVFMVASLLLFGLYPGFEVASMLPVEALSQR